ncbi:Os06g0270982 [Oryza sativa Japonica Group]|uniref:Os06g0270982 protein n=1 Tax=Oryza sativa subsp. japonica TaxID=39947 RepID=A0A0P0WV95_ORYSJ|nr:Os06g0270982 [Oryza sativa Japonica Group]
MASRESSQSDTSRSIFRPSSDARHRGPTGHSFTGDIRLQPSKHSGSSSTKELTIMPSLESMLALVSHARSQSGPVGSGSSMGGFRSARVSRSPGKPSTSNGSDGEPTRACGLCAVTAPATYVAKALMP